MTAEGGLQGFLAGLKELVSRFEPGVTRSVTPAAAWVAPGGGVSGEAVPRTQPGPSTTNPTPEVGDTMVATPGTESGNSSGEKVVETVDAAKKQDLIRLADAAQYEVYVCFEGPLGAHLKQVVREKIWKGVYVEIFSLLLLDRVKPEDNKKEDKEKRNYRLIPRMFQNWLQAFAILASVIGEKNPEHCSALFCYLDAIGEAHRVCGGVAWLRYDEQFRQWRAIRPALRWDHKDISLWMRLMTSARAPNQFFPGGAGGSTTPGQSASKKKGVCWQYKEGTCKFGGEL